MKTLLTLLTFGATSMGLHAQFTFANNQAITNNDIVAPVVRVSNELRVANTFSANDPAIGTLDNTGYGINIHKTDGIGFAFNGAHKVIIKPTGEIVAPTFSFDNEIRIANSFNALDPTIGTLDNTSYGINLHKTSGIGFAFNGQHEVVFKPNGDTGIGTDTPLGKLHVSTGTAGDAVLRLEADTDNNDEFDNPIFQMRQDGNQVGVNMGFSNENFGHNVFGIATRWTNIENWNAFTINTETGKVGIGTTIPDDKLTVKGRIHAEEVKVDLSVPGPDYVFKEGYDLKSLEEVQKHIQEHGHLPNIPSAEEMEEKGIELGIMNMKLLEKIEELTLYILEQENRLKRLDVMENEIIQLKKIMAQPTNHK
ncbi:tail fiber protein [Ulvibacterium marinum]|nr:tail fiber protein [Ulvibacterium marinum]